jgi:hypothetical protein
MQKQTTPSINAHLLRGALILVSLVAACTTPFALVAGVFRSGLNTKAVEAGRPATARVPFSSEPAIEPSGAATTTRIS